MTDDPLATLAVTAAETLRRAADRLRALATADNITPGPWRYDPDTYWNRPPFFGQEYVGAGPAREIDCVAGTGPEGQPGASEDAAFIAAMHPGVGAALAQVFDAWARMGELDPDLLHRVGGPETLAAARALLGEAS